MEEIPGQGILEEPEGRIRVQIPREPNKWCEALERKAKRNNGQPKADQGQRNQTVLLRPTNCEKTHLKNSATTEAEEEVELDKDFIENDEAEVVVEFLMGNARSLGAGNKIETTTTIATANKSDVLIFWETGMRDTY